MLPLQVLWGKSALAFSSFWMFPALALLGWWPHHFNFYLHLLTTFSSLCLCTNCAHLSPGVAPPASGMRSSEIPGRPVQTIQHDRLISKSLNYSHQQRLFFPPQYVTQVPGIRKWLLLESDFSACHEQITSLPRGHLKSHAQGPMSNTQWRWDLNPAVSTSEAHSLYNTPPTKAEEQTLNQQVTTEGGGSRNTHMGFKLCQ